MPRCLRRFSHRATGIASLSRRVARRPLIPGTAAVLYLGADPVLGPYMALEPRSFMPMLDALNEAAEGRRGSRIALVRLIAENRIDRWLERTPVRVVAVRDFGAGLGLGLIQGVEVEATDGENKGRRGIVLPKFVRLVAAAG